MKEDHDPARPATIVVFEVAGGRYALRLEQVRTVCAAVSVVALPKAPAIVEGVIDVGGRLVPVLDLRARFRLPPRPPALDEHLLIAQAGPRWAALRADRVTGVVQVPASAIAAPSDASARVEYVCGIAHLLDGLVLIHDLGAFLSASEAEQLDEARGAAGGGR